MKGGGIVVEYIRVPNTDRVREAYREAEWNQWGTEGEEFDLWLAANNAEVAATALEEAADETRSLIHAAELRNRAAAIRSTVKGQE